MQGAANDIFIRWLEMTLMKHPKKIEQAGREGKKGAKVVTPHIKWREEKGSALRLLTTPGRAEAIASSNPLGGLQIESFSHLDHSQNLVNGWHWIQLKNMQNSDFIYFVLQLIKVLRKSDLKHLNTKEFSQNHNWMGNMIWCLKSLHVYAYYLSGETFWELKLVYGP